MSVSLSIQNRIIREIVPSSVSTRGGIAHETVRAQRPSHGSFKWTLFIRSPCTEVRERTDGGRGCECGRKKRKRSGEKKEKKRKEKERAVVGVGERQRDGWRGGARERVGISRMDLSSNVARK